MGTTTTYSLQNIKKELAHLPKEQLIELVARIARHKKENKELLVYLLFEASDEAAFIEKVKAGAGFMFSQLPAQNYHAAKGLRNILKLIGKYTKFMASKGAEIELLISFCTNYLQYVDRKTSFKPLRLVLTVQLEKIRTLIRKLHQDLQFDYSHDYNNLITEADSKLNWFNKKDYQL